MVLEFPGSPHEDWSRWIPALLPASSADTTRFVSSPPRTTPTHNLGCPNLLNRETRCMLDA